MPDASHDDLDTQLRHLAQNTHPRPAFAARLRGELAGSPAGRPWLGFLAWARPYAAQLAVLLALVGLVFLALRLTPHLFGPDRLTGQQGTPALLPAGQPTAVGGNPTPTQGVDVTYAGALARLGKGVLLSLDSAPDGRLAASAAASVCVYNNGMTADWCVWPSQSALWVGFDPTGRFLAVKLADGTIEKMDAATGEVRASYKPYNAPDSSGQDLAWDPSGGADGAGGRMVIAEPVYTSSPAPTATRPGDNPPAVTDSGPGSEPTTDISVWDWDNHTTVWGPVSVRGNVRAVAWAKGADSGAGGGAGGESLLAVGGDNGLVLFDGATGAIKQALEPTWQAAPVANISALAFAPDGSWLAYGYPNGVAALQLQGGKVAGQTRIWPGASMPNRLAWGGPGQIAAVMGGNLQLYALDGKAPQVTLPNGFSSALAWSADHTKLYHTVSSGALAVYAEGQDGIITVEYTSVLSALTWKNADQITAAGRALYTWDIAAQSVGLVQESTPPGGSVQEPFLAVAPGGKRALTAGYTLLDTASGEPVARLDPGFAGDQAAFSPDGSRVALASPDGTVVTYDAATGQKDLEAQAVPANAHVTGIAWGASIGPESDPIAVTWQIPEEGPEGVYKGGVSLLTASGIAKGSTGTLFENDAYLSLPTFSADGQRLAVADPTGKVIVRAMNGNSERYRLNAPGSVSALAFSPDGQFLTGASTPLLVSWELGSGREVSRTYAQSSRVTALAFAPDGQILASAFTDGTVTLWNAGAGTLPHPGPADPTLTPIPPDAPPAATETPAPTATLEPAQSQVPPAVEPTITPDSPQAAAAPFPTATIALGTPQARGDGAITGQIVAGYGDHAPLAGQPVYIQEPAQPGGSTDPLAVTDNNGMFAISGLAPGHYRFVSMHLEFAVDIPEGNGIVNVGRLRYPLMHLPDFYYQTPQPVALDQLLAKGEPERILDPIYEDIEWVRPGESEQRERVWSWALSERAIANQGGESVLRAWFNKPAFVYDSRDIFEQSTMRGPDCAARTAEQPITDLPGDDYRCLLGLWNRPTFLEVGTDQTRYGSQALDDLLNRRMIEVWLMGYSLDDPSEGSVLHLSDGANGMHYALKVHPTPGFQVVRFLGNHGAMQVHVVSAGQVVAVLP